jgi:hypothetical protein
MMANLHIFSEDSEDAASIQFAPSDFLSLGRASDVSATALAPPANCDSENLPNQFQPNGLDSTKTQASEKET